LFGFDIFIVQSLGVYFFYWTQCSTGLKLDVMKVNTFVDNEDVLCRVNCWLKEQSQKLHYSKIKAVGIH